MGNKNIQKIETLEGDILIELSRISKDLFINQSSSEAVMDDVVVIPPENIKEFMQALNKAVYAGELQPKYALKFVGSCETTISYSPKIKDISYTLVSSPDNTIYYIVFESMDDLTKAATQIKEHQPSLYYEIITVY